MTWACQTRLCRRMAHFFGFSAFIRRSKWKPIVHNACLQAEKKLSHSLSRDWQLRRNFGADHHTAGTGRRASRQGTRAIA
jgi:hypothetical protein